MKKKGVRTLGFSEILKKVGVNHRVFLMLLGGVVAIGGTYGGYVITRAESGPDVGITYEMTRVIDGDTVELEVRNKKKEESKGTNYGTGTTERIRLIDVQAPELGVCYGVEAKDALERLLLGQELQIEKDISGSDDFGRLVRYVKVIRPSKYEDNVLVNTWMLANGFAVYTESENSVHQKEMLNAQAAAQVKGVGLWGACTALDRQKMGVAGAKIKVLPSDPKCVIKGNITDALKKKVYLLPHCPNYKTTGINPDIGEAYFCTEEEAVAAGFMKSETCGNKGD